MMSELIRAVLFTASTMVLFGGAYPLALWVVGRTVFPSQAEGSLIRRTDGSIAGSRLVAQAFDAPQYFRPRPSAVDYNAASAGGSNLGPGNPEQIQAMRDRAAAFAADHQIAIDAVPADQVTASGAGLDPHISPRSADLQADRVAAARGVTGDRIRAAIAEHTEAPALGFLGQPRVNVLELNLALDQSFPVR
jgi:potassium-transporting ATPase KdpC subunit